VTGLTLPAAEAKIRSAITRPRFTLQHAEDTLPAGKVIAQTPASGTQVTPGSPIQLTISSEDTVPACTTPAQPASSTVSVTTQAGLFAGTTVCIALLGMLVLGVGYVSGLGIAAAITVLFTVAAAVTLLPALLGVLGMRVLSRRERRRLAAGGPASGGTTTRHAYELLADGFGPGFNGPLQLAGTTTTPAATAAFTRLAATLKTEPGIAAVSAPVAGHGASVISVIPATSPEAAATSTLISHLRDSVIPAASSCPASRSPASSASAWPPRSCSTRSCCAPSWSRP